MTVPTIHALTMGCVQMESTRSHAHVLLGLLGHYVKLVSIILTVWDLHLGLNKNCLLAVTQLTLDFYAIFKKLKKKIFWPTGDFMNYSADQYFLLLRNMKNFNFFDILRFYTSFVTETAYV